MLKNDPFWLALNNKNTFDNMSFPGRKKEYKNYFQEYPIQCIIKKKTQFLSNISPTIFVIIVINLDLLFSRIIETKKLVHFARKKSSDRSSEKTLPNNLRYISPKLTIE